MVRNTSAFNSGRQVRRGSLRLDHPARWAELTEGMIKAYCQNQIAHYKIPRYVRVVSELPLTVTGKLQKFVMRDEMLKILGQSD